MEQGSDKECLETSWFVEIGYVCPLKRVSTNFELEISHTNTTTPYAYFIKKFLRVIRVEAPRKVSDACLEEILENAFPGYSFTVTELESKTSGILYAIDVNVPNYHISMIYEV
tara:strand:- start:157 stop:495 length:339 start_codon:yes stop_codon:yes gene_type:complete